MRTERDKKRDHLADLLKLGGGPTDRQSLAAFLLAYGVDVTLPPEPQWRPGQYVMLENPYAHERVIARRSDDNAGWLIPGATAIYGDDEVGDIEPVAVLTAEDARDLGEGRGIGSFERFFRKRGLDL